MLLYRDQMQNMAEAIKDNFIGESTIEAEFWADTLDRWAEQLVDPLPEAGTSRRGGTG